MTLLRAAALFALLSNPALADEIVHADANHCEVYVDGFASAYAYNMGWSATRLHADVVVRDPEVRQIGLWVRYRDEATGMENTATVEQALSAAYGERSSAIEFLVSESFNPMGGGQPPRQMSLTPVEVAFFADKPMADGTMMRLWLSNGGANFRYSDIMSGSTYTDSRGRMTFTWANQNVALFGQKKFCAR